MDETFGLHYERTLRESFGNKRVHVNRDEIFPHQLTQQHWVFYLPESITDGVGIAPELARVERVTAEAGVYHVWTTKGSMRFVAGEKVQVVA